MPYRSEGIVLKRRNIGEADRILTIFTRHRGKISVIAKGVRRMQSRKGGNVELLNWITLFCAEGKNLDILTEVETKASFQRLKNDLVLVGYAYHVIEILDRLLPERDPDPRVFRLVIEFLHELERRPRKILVRAFEVKLLDLLGFWSSRQLGFEDPEVTRLSEQLRIGDWAAIRSIAVDEKKAVVLESLLHQYLEQTAETSLRSPRFLKKIRSR